MSSNPTIRSSSASSTHRILILNHYAGSAHHGMEYRSYFLAREWVKQGHEVTIVAASFSHLRTQAPRIAGRVTEESIERIRYLWYDTPAYHGNGFGRAWNIFSFVRQIWLDAGRLAKIYHPEAVVASSTYPLDIYPARRLARMCRAQLVYEVHDLWPLSPLELGIISPWNPLAIISQHAENYACRHADHIISVLPKADGHFQEHGMAAHKFAWIPNGIAVDEWRASTAPLPEEHAETVARLRKRGAFLVGYAGGHGVTNALENLIEAAGRLQAAPVAFVLVGQGTHKKQLQDRAGELGLKNTVFLPPIPKAAIPAFLLAMDALYIGWNREPVYRFGISPNKLADYMISGRPVIHAVEAGNDPVAESGSGLSCAPDDPAALAETVKRMMSLTPAVRDAMAQKGKAYVMQNLDYTVLARRFLDTLFPVPSRDASKQVVKGA